MRIAGIPARVVTGYQGAEYNPWDGYWLVRQNQAHAWDEVWLGDQGWVRVDPTFVVQPERIETGSLAWLGKGFRFFGDSYQQSLLAWDGFRFRAELAFFGGGGEFPVLFDLASVVKGIEYRLALDGLVLAVVMGLFIFAIFRFFKWRQIRRNPLQELLRQYARLCAIFAHKGAPRFFNEGPLAYAKRLLESGLLPSRDFEEVFTKYAQLRYGAANVGHEELRQFAKLIGSIYARKRLLQNNRRR